MKTQFQKITCNKNYENFISKLQTFTFEKSTLLQPERVYYS